MSEVKRMDIAEFVDEGYLQELNRRFLHPLGLALEVVTDEDGRPTHFGGVWDFRDDPEGLIYGPETIDVRKVQHVRRIENGRTTPRIDALGYWIQPVNE